MGTNTASETDSSDTDARIDTTNTTADRPDDITKTGASILAGSSHERPDQSGFFERESDGANDDLDGFVADVTTIAQSQCEHCEGYANIVVQAPLGHRERV